MTQTANLFVFAAPSGGGKTSLVNALLAEMPGIEPSISHTTRPMRGEEKNGQHYHFVSEAIFSQMLQADEFIESATVFSHQYGTSKQQINQRLSQGIDVLLDIDWQGARQLKALYDNVVTIYILPPSVNALRSRLQGRKTDDEQTIQYRMNKAKHEMVHYKEFDYLLINDDFQDTLQSIKHIILAERLKCPLQALKHQTIISDLLDK